MSTGVLMDGFGWTIKLLTSCSVLISTPIYISVLVCIYRHRKKVPFNSPFFTCFLALGIVDLSCYWLFMIEKLNFWDRTIPFLLPANQPNTASSIIYFIIWMIGMAQWEMNILISLNRFVSLMFPLVYIKLWTPRLNKFYIASVLIICTAFTVPILWTPCGIRTTILIGDTQNFTKLTGPVFMDLKTANFYISLWKSHTYILLAICIFCYPPIFIKIHRLNLKKDTKMQYEVKMLYSLVALLVLSVAYISFLLSREYLIKTYEEYGRYADWMLYILADVYDLHNPYNLLVTCSEVRKHTFPFLLHRFIFPKPSITETQPLPALNQQHCQGNNKIHPKPIQQISVAPGNLSRVKIEK